MKNHICKESHTCSCDIQGLEPDEGCPVHGMGEWPPRCDICGRFMKQLILVGQDNNTDEI